METNLKKGNKIVINNPKSKFWKHYYKTGNKVITQRMIDMNDEELQQAYTSYQDKMEKHEQAMEVIWKNMNRLSEIAKSREIELKSKDSQYWKTVLEK